MPLRWKTARKRNPAIILTLVILYFWEKEMLLRRKTARSLFLSVFNAYGANLHTFFANVVRINVKVAFVAINITKRRAGCILK